MSKKSTTKAARSLIPEGTSSEFDLGNSEAPTTEMLESLDAAMDEAGIGISDDPAPTPAATDPIEPIVDPQAPIEEPAPADPTEPAVDPVEPTEPAEPTEPKTPTDPEPTAEELEARRIEELKAINLDQVEPPPGVSPRNLVNFDKLREIAKLRTQEVETLRKETEELRQKTAAELPAEEKKELEELRMFRKIFDTENDPEFKKQFDQKLSAVDEDVIAILKTNGLPEATEKQMRDLGLGRVSSKFWEQQILPRLSFVDQERVRRRLAERADVDDQRSKEIEKFQSQREQTVQRREEEQHKQFQAEQEAVVKHVEEIRKDIPWATRREIPAKATKEERAQLEAHNKHVEELEFRFQDALYPANPQARAEIAAAAVASTVLAASVTDLGSRLQEANAKVKQLEAQISKIKSAGRIPSGESASRAKQPEQSESFKTDDDAIEAGLAAAESAL